jgi:hypothetical protein
MSLQYYENKTLTTSEAFKKLQEFKNENPQAIVNMSFEAVVSFYNSKPLARFLDEAKGKLGIKSVQVSVKGFLLKTYKINICGMASPVYSVITDVASMYPNADYDA